MPKNQKRTPAEKAKARATLIKNQKAKYEKLLKAEPNHKDAPLWKEKLSKL